jgi:uncharacterized protein (DUF169 family)
MALQSGLVVKNNEHSQKLHNALRLHSEPIAIKMIINEAEVPPDAVYPMRDMKKHIALCQAFYLTRKEKKTIYMQKEDHWCWNPPVGLGHVDCGEDTKAFEVVCSVLGVQSMDAARSFFKKFPRFPLDKYKGIVTAPLENCPFEPDVVMIYSNNLQLRSMLFTIKSRTGKLVATELDAIDSCIYEIVVPMQTGEYRVTLPDLGETERAAPESDEIVLSVPGRRMDELVDNMSVLFGDDTDTSEAKSELVYDFPRPPFYNTLFELWGLEKGEDWKLK